MHFNRNSFLWIFTSISKNTGVFMQCRWKLFLSKDLVWFGTHSKGKRVNKMSKEERPCIPIGDALVPLFRSSWPALHILATIVDNIISRDLRPTSLYWHPLVPALPRNLLWSNSSPFNWKCRLVMQRIILGLIFHQWRQELMGKYMHQSLFFKWTILRDILPPLRSPSSCFNCLTWFCLPCFHVSLNHILHSYFLGPSPMLRSPCRKFL